MNLQLIKKLSNNSSSAVARELFIELGMSKGYEYLDYPKKGDYKELKLNFLDNALTEVVMARPETSSFCINGIVSDEPLPGETICETHQGNAAITMDGGILRFSFNPMILYVSNINEEFKAVNSSRLRTLALQMYWASPGLLRNKLRNLLRKQVLSRVRNIRNLSLLGVANNVIVKIIEKHLEINHSLDINKSESFAVITHDVDTDFCQTTGLNPVLDIELKMRCPATWFFVPNSVQYDLRLSSLKQVSDAGHEVGMHGYRHDGLLPLNDFSRLLHQLMLGKRRFDSAGIQVVSYRNPWALRSQYLQACLVQAGFIADSSYPDIDTLGLTGNLHGVSYNRPYRPFIFDPIGFAKTLNIWEFPMTGPQDVQLIEDLNIEGDELLGVWKYKAEFCKDFGGTFIFHTHPTHIFEHLDTYSRMLSELKSMKFNILTMQQLAEQLETRLHIN